MAWWFLTANRFSIRLGNSSTFKIVYETTKLASNHQERFKFIPIPIRVRGRDFTQGMTSHTIMISGQTKTRNHVKSYSKGVSQSTFAVFL